MFRNLWYVIAPVSALGEAVLPVRLLGQQFVAFRDTEGQPRLLAGTCVHRGAALAGGRNVTGTLECPYHGWRFAGDGHCVHIPAQPDLPVPRKARVDAYPVVEHRGWLWAFLGDLPASERPALPELAWMNDPAVRVVRGHYDWDAGWERVMENGLDFAHAPFVHGTTFGDPEHPEIEPFSVCEDDAWSAHADMIMRRPRRSLLTRRPLQGERIAVTTTPGFHMSGPCTTLHLNPRKDWHIHIVAAHVPLDASHTRTWWAMGRTFMRSAVFDGQTIRRNLRIFEQDHAVLQHVRPEKVPDDWQTEVSVKSDALQIAFRRHLRRMEQAGWRIDLQRLESEYNGRQACAVGCPERRTSEDWAIDEVPCVAPAKHS